jgi:predicted kinase
MEAVIFVGIPGSGKSSFYKERFFSTHVRISLDLVRTRHRERRLLELCLDTDQRFVLDNTNPTRADRASVIPAARARRFRTVGYYFQSQVDASLARNACRPEIERVPDIAILSIAKKLELPALEEGFDELYYIRLSPAGFICEEWRDDLR